MTSATPPELDHAPAPAETLRRVLAEKGMSQRELATRTGLTAKHVNQVLQGVATLTPEVAERLDLATGVPARLWNRLEADYRGVQTRLQQRRDLDAEQEWVAEMPVAAMVKRGLLPAEPKDSISRARQLLAFFGVASPNAWRELWLRPNAAFRQTEAFQADPGAVAAWLREGEVRARAVTCQPFDSDGLRALLPRLRALSLEDPDVFGKEIRSLLAGVGVAVVYLPEVVGARVNGATLWLGPAKAAVVLSLRYGTDDVFFFTLFHELGHLLLHGRKETFVNDEHPRDRRENEANDFAGDQLIPSARQMDLAGIKTKLQAEDFARAIGVSPGIVVGRLHHDNTWTPWSKGAKMKRSVASLARD